MTAGPSDPYLPTPGPLTTSAATKRAMFHDWGARDRTFTDINRGVLRRPGAIEAVARPGVSVPA